jgi:WD40 repeat protein
VDQSLIFWDLSPDGRLVAVGGNDGAVRVWETAGDRLRFTLLTPDSYPSSLLFSPDGRWLASISGKVIHLWEVATGRLARTLEGPTEPVHRLAFSPDSKVLAAGGGTFMTASELRTWDVASGKERHNLPGHTSVLSAVAFSPDGKTLASASAGGTIRLWDAESGAMRGILAEKLGSLSALAFSPDGRAIVTGGTGGVRLWDSASGQELLSLGPPGWHPFSVVFSPDGRQLAASGNGKVVRVWDLEPPSPERRQERCRQVTRSLAAGTSARRIRPTRTATGSPSLFTSGNSARLGPKSCFGCAAAWPWHGWAGRTRPGPSSRPRRNSARRRTTGKPGGIGAAARRRWAGQRKPWKA